MDEVIICNVCSLILIVILVLLSQFFFGNEWSQADHFCFVPNNISSSTERLAPLVPLTRTSESLGNLVVAALELSDHDILGYPRISFIIIIIFIIAGFDSCITIS